jgi:HSP90 family molecular chaperone
VEAPEPVSTNSETKEFKAETRKLLDIVAKSIYTDKEVFLRELLSNCSDALEKHRFRITSGEENVISANDDLAISITTNSKDRTITIFDSGVGMDRSEVVDNLGTIARSGSANLLEKLNSTEQGDSGLSDSIIGQFGVGFYSTFVVSDHVEVITKKQSGSAVKWVSDGSGSYEVADLDSVFFDRGTQIKLRLLPDVREFSQETPIETIIKKFSQFISFPIKLNGKTIN